MQKYLQPLTIKIIKYFILFVGVLGLAATLLNVFYFKDTSSSNIGSFMSCIYLIFISFRFEKMITWLNSKLKRA
ncbi:hypothetical protein PXC01_04115 [Maribacter sp. M208]|uniref:hypothetical protein n=1 Tax=Maribacter huludaoensis TaxID=3030010 RepID=UPI0023EC785A|nr:hypothetical protein [Maribacter huludaoensis]MDF4220761.1 hypothetical protein [Maribacter huludaoensis]